MPVASCPPEIKAMMNIPVTWEKFKGFDGHGEPSYDPLITLYCWVEDHGFLAGGMEAKRRNEATTVDVEYDLFFSGDDPNAKGFALWDRFTVPVIAGGASVTLQASLISTFYGPPFDNRNPWVIKVSLS